MRRSQLVLGKGLCLCRLLARHGLCFLCRNYGYTALEWALHSGYTETAKVLLAAGAEAADVTLSQLKKLCKVYGLAQTGRKDNLVERLAEKAAELKVPLPGACMPQRPLLEHNKAPAQISTQCSTPM